MLSCLEEFTHSTKVRVSCSAGLHIRCACQLVNCLRRFKSKIVIQRNDIAADAKSIINLLILGAEFGAELEVVAKGVDAPEAIEAVKEYFNCKQQFEQHTHKFDLAFCRSEDHAVFLLFAMLL